MIGLPSYLFISTILFLCGIIVVIARKNIIAILLGLELILNAAALNFVAYNRYINTNGSLDGNTVPLFIIVVAAAEAAIGLAIVIRFFQLRESIHIDDATQLLN